MPSLAFPSDLASARDYLGKYHTIREIVEQPTVPTPPPSDHQNTSPKSEQDQISQNIEAVLDFYAREEQKVGQWQRMLERISLFIGQPFFPGFVLLFVALWILANTVLRLFGQSAFDPPPYAWLQGIIGLSALLTATIVLGKQNRLSRLEEHRAHLDLTVTLLTEQKAAKLIDLLEELRRDLPNVKNRHDPEAAALQQSMNPDLVLAALDELNESGERLKPDTEAKAVDAGNAQENQ